MRPTLALLAISFTLLFVAFSPGAIAGMGYTAEDMRAGNELLGLAPAAPFHMPRNGILPIVLDLPFLAAGAVVFPPVRARVQDLVLSLEPAMLTGLLVTLVFYWAWRISRRVRTALTISLIAGFCTILWPYAYIGLETKQSLFLLVAAFVAMEHRRPESWLAATTFAVSSAFAIGAKSTGTFLLPVFGFLVWEYSRRVRLAHVSAGRSRGLVALAAFVPIAGFLANSYARSFFWRDWGGSASFIQFWLVTDPLTPALNVAAFLGSPNKGLWVFSPICLVACYAIPRAWTTRPRLVLFAVLTLAGLAGGFSLLRNWADETWGPRYLHASICPLLLALVAAYPRPGTGTRTVLGVAAALGLAAAVLGVLFPYGALPAAATMTGQNTLEGYQGDIGLNHLRFNAQLLGAWRHPEQSHAWGAKKQWFYEAPADALPPKSVDLRVFSTPQPVLVRHLFTPKPGIIGWVWGGYLACLLAGLVLLAVAALRMRSVPDG